MAERDVPREDELSIVSHARWDGIGDFAALRSFLDEQLRANTHLSVFAEYPSVFRPLPGGESILIKRKDRIVSHLAYLTRVFHFNRFSTKIGLIGSLATDPEFRNRGLASSLLVRAFHELKKSGCTLAILWSNNDDFYTPLGFFRGGRERVLELSEGSVARVASSSDLPAAFAAERHLEGTFQLYLNHRQRLDRTLVEHAELLSIPRTRTFVLENGKRVEAYAVINRGADFKNWVHEWGGDATRVTELLASIQKNILGARHLKVLVPFGSNADPLRGIAVNEKVQPMAFVKLLDRGRLLGHYLRYLRDEGFVYQWEADAERLAIGSDLHTLQTDAQYLRTVIGSPASGNHPTLPLFFWGLDSI